MTTNSAWTVACPSCQKAIRIPAQHAGKFAKCPGCRTRLYMCPSCQALVPSAADQQKGHCPRCSPKPPAAPTPPQPPPPPPPIITPSPLPHELALATAGGAQPIKPPDLMPKAVPQPALAPRARALPRISPPAIRRSIYIWLHFLMPLFLILAGFAGATTGERMQWQTLQSLSSFGMCCLGPLWLAFGFYPARFIAEHLTPFFVKTIVCPMCGFETDAVGRWTAGAFTDHREQHVLRFRSPIDGSAIGHTNCPVCDTTILLR